MRCKTYFLCRTSLVKYCPPPPFPLPPPPLCYYDDNIVGRHFTVCNTSIHTLHVGEFFFPSGFKNKPNPRKEEYPCQRGRSHVSAHMPVRSYVHASNPFHRRRQTIRLWRWRTLFLYLFFSSLTREIKWFSVRQTSGETQQHLIWIKLKVGILDVISQGLSDHLLFMSLQLVFFLFFFPFPIPSAFRIANIPSSTCGRCCSTNSRRPFKIQCEKTHASVQQEKKKKKENELWTDGSRKAG